MKHSKAIISAPPISFNTGLLKKDT